MPPSSPRRPVIGPVVAPRIGRQRLPQRLPRRAPRPAAALPPLDPFPDETDRPDETDEPGGTGGTGGTDLPGESDETAGTPGGGDGGQGGEDDGGGGGTGGGGIVGLVVVVVVLLVLLPVVFWFLDYGSLNPFASSPTGSDQPPSALTGAGTYVDARVQPGGTVRVTQWVRPPTDLRSVGLKAQGRSGPTAVATGLRLSADGRSVTGPARVGHAVAVYRWRSPARLLRLTYTLGGVVDPGRTTARRTVLASTFLAVRYPSRSGPTVVRVSGTGVRGISCAPVLGTAGPRPCGQQVTASDWRVTLGGTRFKARVLALVGVL